MLSFSIGNHTLAIKNFVKNQYLYITCPAPEVPKVAASVSAEEMKDPSLSIVKYCSEAICCTEIEFHFVMNIGTLPLKINAYHEERRYYKSNYLISP